ncbi:uncharacterized protein LOC133731538 [Rosa rugosa]|uniref:uncharacterized protein LOC133731538 n=1 Tax=Rosa rugosa TaxID=74645 RepID=UPI002B408B4B|nr:uncharacterized protein LOC133731538 [Rosa rugosa]
MDNSTVLQNCLLSNFYNLITVRLDDSNYVLWKFLVETMFSGCGLIRYIDGSFPRPPQYIVIEEGGVTSDMTKEYMDWVQNDSSVMFILVATLSSDALSFIVGSKTSREIWCRLKKRYVDDSVYNIMNLKASLYNIQKGSDSIDKYLLQVKSICDQLATMGVYMADEDIVDSVLHGLPLEFATIKTIIRIKTLSSSVSMEELRSLLLIAESEIEQTMKSMFERFKTEMMAHGDSFNRYAPAPTHVTNAKYDGGIQYNFGAFDYGITQQNGIFQQRHNFRQNGGLMQQNGFPQQNGNFSPNMNYSYNNNANFSQSGGEGFSQQGNSVYSSNFCSKNQKEAPEAILESLDASICDDVKLATCVSNGCAEDDGSEVVPVDSEKFILDDISFIDSGWKGENSKTVVECLDGDAELSEYEWSRYDSCDTELLGESQNLNPEVILEVEVCEGKEEQTCLAQETQKTSRQERDLQMHSDSENVYAKKVEVSGSCLELIDLACDTEDGELRELDVPYWEENDFEEIEPVDYGSDTCDTNAADGKVECRETKFCGIESRNINMNVQVGRGLSLGYDIMCGKVEHCAIGNALRQSSVGSKTRTSGTEQLPGDICTTWNHVGSKILCPEEGTYVLLGRASFLGGSMRMIEITNNLKFLKILPLIMLVLLISKVVGDAFNKGLYEGFPVIDHSRNGALKIYAEIFCFLIQVKLALFSMTAVWCQLKMQDLVHLISRNNHSEHYEKEVSILKHKVKDMMDLTLSSAAI